MVHYPDEIEYSDKYMDDYYEYRHVILPKDTYKKLPRGRLLTENVTIAPSRSGGSSASSSPGAGFTTNSTGPSPTSSSSAGPRAQIPRPACLPRASSPPQTPSATDPHPDLNPLPLLVPSPPQSNFEFSRS